ncbi:MAG: methionine/alanine import family NSS transporter small subunit, partial [Rhodococcus sp. (in: high G+C Gram-positive bacteria)]
RDRSHLPPVARIGGRASRRDRFERQRMSTTAIVMMIISLVLVWGGLAVSLLHLRSHPDEDIDI